MANTRQLTLICPRSLLRFEINLTMSTLVEGTTSRNVCVTPPTGLDAALLTGGCDRPYAYGLAMALISKNVRLDVIGSDAVDSPEMHTTPNLKFLNLWPSRTRNQKLVGKASRALRHYVSLVRYAAAALWHYASGHPVRHGNYRVVHLFPADAGGLARIQVE